MFDYRVFYPQIGVAEQRLRRPETQRVTRLAEERRTGRHGSRR